MIMKKRIIFFSLFNLSAGLVLLYQWLIVLLAWLAADAQGRRAGWLFDLDSSLVILSVICLPLFIWLSFLAYRLWTGSRDGNSSLVRGTLYATITTLIFMTVVMLPILILTIPIILFAIDTSKKILPETLPAKEIV